MTSRQGPPAPAHPSAATASARDRRPVARTAALLAALLTALGLAVLIAPAASAHTQLESSDPADGAVLQAAPAAVSLTFSEELIDLAPVVLVTGPDAQPHQSGAVRVNGATISIDVAPLTVAGDYTVAYRVVSDDGHPVEGQVVFTLAVPAVSPPISEPAGTSASPSQASAATAGSSSAAAAAPTTAAVASTAAESSGPSGWLWVAVIAAVALLSAGGVAIARRRARQT